MLELADYVGGLPAGCALWRSIGGPLAWSEQMHMLNLIDYRLAIANWFQTEDAKRKKNRPKLQTPPPFAHEKRAEQSRESARATAWEQRQLRRQPDQ